MYGYTHHLFPIDINEAKRIGLDPTLMDAQTYDEAFDIVTACHGKNFVGFLSEAEAAEVERARNARPERDGRAPLPKSPADLATAEAAVARRRSRQTDGTQELGDSPDDVVTA